jgi:hypothetical protein
MFDTVDWNPEESPEHEEITLPDVSKISIDTHTGQVYPGPFRVAQHPERFVPGFVARAVLPMVKRSWRLDHGWATA